MSGWNAADSHSVKMPLEMAQVLSTVIRRHMVDILPDTTEDPEGGIYKTAHAHHPATLWAGENFENFCWVMRYALALCETYEERYGKPHTSLPVILRCNEFRWVIPEGTLTPFVQCINVPGIKALGLPTPEAYRVFMAYKFLTKRKLTSTGKLQVFVDWRKVKPPVWLADALPIARGIALASQLEILRDSTP